MFGLSIVSVVVGVALGQIPAVAVWVKKQLTSAKKDVAAVTSASITTTVEAAVSDVKKVL